MYHTSRKSTSAKAKWPIIFAHSNHKIGPQIPQIWLDVQTCHLKGSETTVPGIGSFNCININGNTSFPYLDIQLSWTEAVKLRFNVYKKPGKLIKYLNTDSHHHTNHKTAVLQGVELRLALLTMVSDKNKNLSLSEIYLDKHEALSIAGQIKTSEKMRTLREVLNNNSWSGPTRLETQSRAINKHDSLFIVKYANLGRSNGPINQIIRSTRNEFKLKWLHPRVIYSCHSNLQEKLLGNLKRIFLWGITDANLGCHPQNCPRNHTVNGLWAYGSNSYSCQTAGTVYKITCKDNGCNCFYIGKSQQYVKK